MEPGFPLLRRPAPLADQQVPHIGMVERPEDVGRRVTSSSGRALPTPLKAGSFEEWWARTSALAGPLAKILECLPDPAKLALAARLRETVAPYATASGIELPGVTLIASARR